MVDITYAPKIFLFSLCDVLQYLYILFENASGYALFKTAEFEEVAIFVPEVRRSVKDTSKFRSVVQFVSFHKFKNTQKALENMKDIVNGKLHLDLQLFLENNIPKAKEKSKLAVVLGVQDAALASAITETLNIQCLTSVIVFEILRGIRLHFLKFIKGYADPDTVKKSHLGLSHHYARAKMNINSHKFDMMITEAVSAVDDLDKNINTLCARL
ncbi:nucleolar protein 56, partial [Trichonephila clavata]